MAPGSFCLSIALRHWMSLGDAQMCFPAQNIFRSLSAWFLLPDHSWDARTAALPLATGIIVTGTWEVTRHLPEHRAPRSPAALTAAALSINN